jgi:hypothetical protein
MGTLHDPPPDARDAVRDRFCDLRALTHIGRCASPLDGFEHPTCFDTDGQGSHVDIGDALTTTHPVGPNE